MTFIQAKRKAKAESEAGYVQHVNRLHEGGFTVSDWFGDSTVASYENGKRIDSGRHSLNGFVNISGRA